jgi:hypothetical protein
VIPEQHIQRCFGALTSAVVSDTGYILFYEDRLADRASPPVQAPLALPVSLPVVRSTAGRPGTLSAAAAAAVPALSEREAAAAAVVRQKMSA